MLIFIDGVEYEIDHRDFDFKKPTLIRGQTGDRSFGTVGSTPAKVRFKCSTINETKRSDLFLQEHILKWESGYSVTPGVRAKLVSDPEEEIMEWEFKVS